MRIWVKWVRSWNEAQAELKEARKEIEVKDKDIAYLINQMGLSEKVIVSVERKLSEANKRIAELEEQNKKYWFMIEHGLGVEDMTPPTYPHP